MSSTWNILFQIHTWDCLPFDSSVWGTAVSSGAFHNYPIWKYHLCPISNTPKPLRWLAVSSSLTLADARSSAVYWLPHSAQTNHCTRGLFSLQHPQGLALLAYIQHFLSELKLNEWMDFKWTHSVYICQALSQHQDRRGSDDHGIISSFKEN